MSPKSKVVALSASSALDNNNHNIVDQKEKIKSQILRIRIERDFAKQRQFQNTEEKRHKLKTVTHTFQKRHDAFIRDNSVRTYAPYMRSSEMPTYLLVLQAKVLKLLHQLCVADEQQKLVEVQSKRTVAGIRKEIFQLGEERTELELRMLNYMAEVQAEEQDMHKSYESILSLQNEELELLQEVDEEDSLTQRLFDQIANESVIALKYKQEAPPPTLSRGDSSSSSFSFRLRTPNRKKKVKELTLQEMLSTGEKEKHTMHASITESTDDDSSSFVSFSVKMSQSFGFIFDNPAKRSTSPRDESML